MKHWEKPYWAMDEIRLLDNQGESAGVLTVEKTSEGFRFAEDCDQYFDIECTKEEALELIEELKEWINEN